MRRGRSADANWPRTRTTGPLEEAVFKGSRPKSLLHNDKRNKNVPTDISVGVAWHHGHGIVLSAVLSSYTWLHVLFAPKSTTDLANVGNDNDHSFCAQSADLP